MTGACLLRRSDRVELYADKRSLWSVGGLVRSEDASRSSLKDSRLIELIRRNEQSGLDMVSPEASASSALWIKRP